MNYLLYVLVIISSLLIFAEIFIPSFGIVGITGIIIFIGTVIYTIATLPNPLFFVLQEIILFTASVYYIYKYLKYKGYLNNFILKSSLTLNTKKDLNDTYTLGQEGITISPLRPFGQVKFNDTIVEANSLSGYINKDVQVKIKSIKGNKIVVDKL